MQIFHKSSVFDSFGEEGKTLENPFFVIFPFVLCFLSGELRLSSNLDPPEGNCKSKKKSVLRRKESEDSPGNLKQGKNCQPLFLATRSSCFRTQASASSESQQQQQQPQLLPELDMFNLAPSFKKKSAGEQEADADQPEGNQEDNMPLFYR